MAVKLLTTIQRFSGLAADTKPAVGTVPVGSTYWATDTNKYYESNGSSWIQKTQGAFEDTTNDAISVIEQSPVFSRYIDFVPHVSAQDLTAAYADFGGQINCTGYNTLGLVVKRDVNDSINVDMKILMEMTSGGTDDVEIDGISITQLWGASGADGSTYYEFDVGTIPYAQVQAIAGTVGATAGDLTISYNLFYK